MEFLASISSSLVGALLSGNHEETWRRLFGARVTEQDVANAFARKGIRFDRRPDATSTGQREFSLESVKGEPAPVSASFFADSCDTDGLGRPLTAFTLCRLDIYEEWYGSRRYWLVRVFYV